MARFQSQIIGRSITHDGKRITAFEINHNTDWQRNMMRCQCGSVGTVTAGNALRMVDGREVVTCKECDGVGFAFFGREA